MNLAVRERKWSLDLACPALDCGECAACEKHESRREFAIWETTDGMIPSHAQVMEMKS
jgi:hypothetical protein